MTMTRKAYTNLGVKLSDKHHKKVKILAAARGIGMQQFVQELIDSASGPGDIDLLIAEAVGLRQLGR